MMSSKYNPDIPHRRSIRLKGYDYSQSGAYFVTSSVQNKECLFGAVVDGEMMVNEAGEMVINVWHDLPKHYGKVTLDEFIIMPNHIHGIIVLCSGDVGAGFKPAHSDSSRAGFKPALTEIKQHGLSEIVRALKTFSSRQINETRNTPGKLWQRNYYEHVIRNDDELNRIREYIVNNPARWTEHEENLGNVKQMLKMCDENDRTCE